MDHVIDDGAEKGTFCCFPIIMVIFSLILYSYTIYYLVFIFLGLFVIMWASQPPGLFGHFASEKKERGMNMMENWCSVRYPDFFGGIIMLLRSCWGRFVSKNIFCSL